ncbi:hypothetical protein CR158_05460 [Halomonas heilongjiangensis]|uniref:Uncharacterized protein n=1 Tax=Halomonas heilongjiangensis TaxID=1387883 RepID=A0A2N7TJB1_9GAMM|nr:hypothetical protein C1H66_15750 [Halomonas heilongjiangensis]PXX93132.1 hypothetical protein CR158_05460 [Halomonas heilongjiangensis]
MSVYIDTHQDDAAGKLQEMGGAQAILTAIAFLAIRGHGCPCRDAWGKPLIRWRYGAFFAGFLRWGSLRP